ncbi:MAG TPA: phosphoserine phosphatase SerB [Planctomycetes bacterium]|nr:phosphoserine phosphatase SerB [Planctomycetota bacterium]
MTDVLLITIAGRDRPGITTRITGVLASCGAQVLDVAQSVIHDQLSLGMMVAIPEGGTHADVVKETLFAAHELGMQVRFDPIDRERYEGWVAEQGHERHSLILLGRGLTAEQISATTAVIAKQGLNIFAIQRLSGRVSLANPPATPRSCVEFLLRGRPADGAGMRAAFLDLSAHLGVDIAIQADDMYRRSRRLVCFDMDSTLIQTEVIDELAEAAGVGAQVKAITESAMRGELDFAESFTRRVALLRGLDAAVLADIAQRLPLTEGAERLCKVLKRLGYRLAILSGGFTYFGRHLQQRLGIDIVHANELEIVDGRLTGRHLGEIVDAKAKAAWLRRIAADEGICQEQTIAVGDGANDLAMLSAAGLGIAFHAKPVVRASAEHAISSLGLDALLYMIGLRDWQVDRI